MGPRSTQQAVRFRQAALRRGSLITPATDASAAALRVLLRLVDHREAERRRVRRLMRRSFIAGAVVGVVLAAGSRGTAEPARR